MPRNFVSIVLLGVLIVAALWFMDSPPPRFQTAPEPDPGDYVLVQYFENIETVQFNPDGFPEHEFRSTRVAHHKPAANIESSAETATISQPRFVFFEKGQAKWTARAQMGETTLTDERILLEQDVHLTQVGGINPSEVLTDSMWIDPANKYAHTDDFVELRARGAVSTGRGLRADVNNEIISILAETKTRYEPSKE